MSKETIVIWQDQCLPAQTSTIIQSERGLPSTLLYLESKYEHYDDRKLKGRTIDGKCISVNESFAFCIRANSTVHNYDRANEAPIINQEAIEEFHSCTSELIIQNAFIGDRFIMSSNPNDVLASFNVSMTHIIDSDGSLGGTESVSTPAFLGSAPHVACIYLQPTRWFWPDARRRLRHWADFSSEALASIPIQSSSKPSSRMKCG